MSKWRWFKRTLFGYKVMFVSPKRSYTVIHRPFRSPIMEASNAINKVPYRTYTQVIFDEVVDTDNLPKKEKDKIDGR